MTLDHCDKARKIQAKTQEKCIVYAVPYEIRIDTRFITSVPCILQRSPEFLLCSPEFDIETIERARAMLENELQPCMRVSLV